VRLDSLFAQGLQQLFLDCELVPLGLDLESQRDQLLSLGAVHQQKGLGSVHERNHEAQQMELPRVNSLLRETRSVDFPDEVLDQGLAFSLCFWLLLQVLSFQRWIRRLRILLCFRIGGRLALRFNFPDSLLALQRVEAGGRLRALLLGLALLLQRLQAQLFSCRCSFFSGEDFAFLSGCLLLAPRVFLRGFALPRISLGLSSWPGPQRARRRVAFFGSSERPLAQSPGVLVFLQDLHFLAH
jgi:hypothetical protein